MSDEKEKKTSSRSLLWLKRGCLSLLAIVVLTPMLCYASVWAYARFGGDWAASQTFPIPSDSQLVNTYYNFDVMYTYKRELYIHRHEPRMLRDWFDQFVRLTPTEGISYDCMMVINDCDDIVSFDPPDMYRSTAHSIGSTAYELHDLSALLMGFPWQDHPLRCNHMRIYKGPVVDSPFEDYTIPDGFTAFEFRTCWRNP